MATIVGTDLQPLRVCIASHYNVGMARYNGLCYEACAAIASMAEATVLAPETVPQGVVRRNVSRVRRAALGVQLPVARRQPVTERFDLFLYICMMPQDLVTLQAMPGWHERSSRAAVFMFESWSARAHDTRAYLRLLDQFDHVFMFNAGGVAEYQRYTSTPCSYLPAAVDCLVATPYLRPQPRQIDIFTMGRTNQTVHEQLVDMTDAGKLLYVYEIFAAPARESYREARRRTYHFIRNSRMFTSFNFNMDGGNILQNEKLRASRGEDAVPARVFEAAAAGAAMIGTAPRVPEWEQLFDWPDALFEMPMDPVDVEAFYLDLQRQPDRVRRAGVLNAARALRKHDWAYRWEEMLRVLDLPVPASVAERKVRLASLAALAEAELELNIVRAS